MDVNQLHDDIRAAYTSDPLTAWQFPQPSDPKWTIVNGLLCLNDRIYVPDVLDLCLRVLRNKHDHPLAGHFGQNKTLELIRREYAWPNLRSKTMSALALRASARRRLSTSLTVSSSTSRFRLAPGIRFLWTLLNTFHLLLVLLLFSLKCLLRK